MEASAAPEVHYDRITDAWQYLLGQDFHYGCFNSQDDSLEAATHNLSVLMAEQGRMGANLSVLDVGCGIGTPARLLAETYGCRVTGISTSAVGIDQATQRARQCGLADRVSFTVADGMANGFPDASFDRVWVLESSHLMPDKEALFSECARVLRPGGILVLCDIMLRRNLEAADIRSKSREFLHLHYTFGHAKLESLDSYQRMLRVAGLQVLEALDLSDSAFPTLRHWQCRLEANVEAVRALIGAEGVEHFRASCEILPTFWQSGIFGYGLIAAARNRDMHGSSYEAEIG
jgi:cyclopropane fatty-acyl-phospholipid synthase-like methyltransferase